MPSLRRSLSSPSVRSSPYPTLGARTNGHQPRRSSGSETRSRRVLADLDWWHVVRGQRDPELDNDSDNALPNDDNLHVFGGAAPPGAERPSTPFNWVLGSQDTIQGLPTTPSAELPRTPTRSRHGRDSTSSSLESTPESSELTSEGIRFASFDFDWAFADAALPPAITAYPRRVTSTSLLSLRTHSLSDFASGALGTSGLFADVQVPRLAN